MPDSVTFVEVAFTKQPELGRRVQSKIQPKLVNQAKVHGLISAMRIGSRDQLKALLFDGLIGKNEAVHVPCIIGVLTPVGTLACEARAEVGAQ